jgi:hypothetical protein
MPLFLPDEVYGDNVIGNEVDSAHAITTTWTIKPGFFPSALQPNNFVKKQQI